MTPKTENHSAIHNKRVQQETCFKNSQKSQSFQTFTKCIAWMHFISYCTGNKSKRRSWSRELLYTSSVYGLVRLQERLEWVLLFHPQNLSEEPLLRASPEELDSDLLVNTQWKLLTDFILQKDAEHRSHQQLVNIKIHKGWLTDIMFYCCSLDCFGFQLSLSKEGPCSAGSEVVSYQLSRQTHAAAGQQALQTSVSKPNHLPLKQPPLYTIPFTSLAL